MFFQFSGKACLAYRKLNNTETNYLFIEMSTANKIDSDSVQEIFVYYMAAASLLGCLKAVLSFAISGKPSGCDFFIVCQKAIKNSLNVVSTNELIPCL